MSSFIISKIYEEVKNIEKKYFDITQEKRNCKNIHIIPMCWWDNGCLWEHKNCFEKGIVSSYFTIVYNPNNIIYPACRKVQDWIKFCIRINAQEYPKEIVKYFIAQILPNPIASAYTYKELSTILNEIFDNCNIEGFYISMGFISNTPIMVPFSNFVPDSSILDSNQRHVLKELIKSIYEGINDLQNEKIKNFKQTRDEYLKSKNGISNYLTFLLKDSFYSFVFGKEIEIEYQSETSTLIIDYNLPNKHEIPNEVLNIHLDWCKMPSIKEKKLYDSIIYSITLRTLAEICHYDDKKYIQHICFNGQIKDRSPFTGQMEKKYILSVNVSREQIESLNLEFVDPKECFKHLKGVSASKLYEQTEIRPIIISSFTDKRFVKSKNVEITQYTNLAEMDWEEFEHLVRQVFEWEFSDKEGEVNVTQSSRDGGVDAIVYDPDPIRGGKIIIQAKRYTNTVPVSAVRDLYGTIINEGANKGIIITTSDYGPDSYKFAQGKPITLLNGGHLLYLMEKHGRHARIDIQEAKENRNNQGNER